MSKLIYIGIIVLIANTMSISQNQYEFIGSIGGGTSLPLGKLNEEYKLGYNVEASYGLMLSNIIGMNISLVYNNYSADFPGYYSGGKLEVTDVNLNLIVGRMKPSEKVNFYGYVGLGFAVYDVGSLKYIEQSSGNMVSREPTTMEAKFGWNGGVRGILTLSKTFGIYGDISYDFYLFYNKVLEDTELRTHVPFRAGLFFAFF